MHRAIEFVEFDPSHLDDIQKTHPTTEMTPVNIRYAESALRNGAAVYSAGLSEISPGHLIAWGRLGDIRPRELLLVAGRMKDVIADAKLAGNKVTAGASVERRAWLERLGFTNIQTVLVATL